MAKGVVLQIRITERYEIGTDTFFSLMLVVKIKCSGIAEWKESAPTKIMHPVGADFFHSAILLVGVSCIYGLTRISIHGDNRTAIPGSMR